MAVGMVTIRALEVNARIVWSLCMKDLKRRNRTSPIGVFSAAAEPLAVMAILALVFSAIRIRVPSLGDHFILFLMTGFLPLYMFRRGATAVRRLMRSERAVGWFPHIRPLHVMLAGLLETAITMIAVYVIMVLAYKAMFRIEEPKNFFLTLIPMFGNGIIGFGFGALNAWIGGWFPYWHTIFATLTAPLGVLSGIFFLASALPRKALDILYYNPIMHSIEYFRQWYYPNYTSTIFDPGYYFGWVFGSFAFALAVERIFNRALMSE